MNQVILSFSSIRPASLMKVFLGATPLSFSFGDISLAYVSPPNFLRDQNTIIAIDSTIGFHLASVIVTGPDKTVVLTNTQILQAGRNVTLDFIATQSGWSVNNADTSSCRRLPDQLALVLNSLCESKGRRVNFRRQCQFKEYWKMAELSGQFKASQISFRALTLVTCWAEDNVSHSSLE